MRNRQAGFGHVVVIASLVLVVAIVVASYVMTSKRNSTNLPAASSNSSNPPQTDKDRALQEAAAYRPDAICADVITPAVHNQTGAAFTFPSACVPPGWTPEESSDTN